jgi:hypothetical protein
LIDLGYQDALKRREEIITFLEQGGEPHCQDLAQ